MDSAGNGENQASMESIHDKGAHAPYHGLEHLTPKQHPMIQRTGPCDLSGTHLPPCKHVVNRNVVRRVNIPSCLIDQTGVSNTLQSGQLITNEVALWCWRLPRMFGAVCGRVCVGVPVGAKEH